MIIIGNENITYDNFININIIQDIQNTKPNSTVLYDYNINTLKYCFENKVSNAVKVSSIKEAIFCNSLNCDYVIVDSIIAKSIQNIAQNYMFDSKVLQIINNDEDIEKVALNEIDGCIYEDVLWVK